MSFGSVITENLDRSFGLYRDLIEGIDESTLGSSLPGLPSNTLGSQLWCVVGARESYSRGIRAGGWAGFSCSLQTTTDRPGVADALDRSARSVLEALRTVDEFTDVQNRLVLDLLEHESAHHGQLIRYLYGLRLAIPAGWKSKYALEDLR